MAEPTADAVSRAPAPRKSNPLVPILIVVLVAGAAVVGYKLLKPQFKELAAAPSPDGAYRCVVRERVPGMGQATYDYRLSIEPAAGGEVAGKGYAFSAEKDTLGPPTISWQGSDHVLVSWGKVNVSKVAGGVSGTILNHQQSWLAGDAEATAKHTGTHRGRHGKGATTTATGPADTQPAAAATRP